MSKNSCKFALDDILDESVDLTPSWYDAFNELFAAPLLFSSSSAAVCRPSLTSTKPMTSLTLMRNLPNLMIQDQYDQILKKTVSINVLSKQFNARTKLTCLNQKGPKLRLSTHNIIFNNKHDRKYFEMRLTSLFARLMFLKYLVGKGCAKKRICSVFSKIHVVKTITKSRKARVACTKFNRTSEKLTTRGCYSLRSDNRGWKIGLVAGC